MEDDKEYIRACELIDNNKLMEAEKILNEIVTRNEDNYKAINKIGTIYAQRKDLDRAKDYFEKCLNKNKDYVPAIVNLANVYKEKGQAAEAESMYLYAIQLDPYYSLSYYNLAVYYKSLNNYDGYFKYLKEYKRCLKNNTFNRQNIKKNSMENNAKYTHFVLIILVLSAVFFLISIIMK